MIKSKWNQMNVNKNKKGGKRIGSGRKPSGRKKEALTLYADFSKFGGKAGARIVIYEFLDGFISKTGETKFLPLDLPDPKKKFPPSDREIKQKSKEEGKWPIVADLTKPTGVLEPQQQPKTNFSINTKPKTLDELKALCPAELTGFDRSAWIANERQKYGI